MDTYDAFVRGLPNKITKNDLEDLFKAYGKVQGISFKKLNSGNQAAFVRFFHKDSLDGALKNLNGYMFQGAKLTVTVDRKARSSFGSPQKSGCMSNGGSPTFKSPSWRSPSYSREERDAGRLFHVGEHIEVLVTHVESAIEFWGQLADDDKNQELAKLTQSLNTYCVTDGEPVSETTSSEVYGALFTADNVWYRTAVIEKPTVDEALVRYIDYGNTETVATCSLVHLSESFKAPPYAYRFRLSGLVLPTTSQQQGCEFVTSTILDKYLGVTIKEVALGDSYEVELDGVAVSDADDTVDVAKKLLESGYALSKSGHSSPFTTPRFGTRSVQQQISDTEFKSVKEENRRLKEQLDTLQRDHQTALLEAISQGMQIQITNLVDKVQSLKELRSQMPLASSSPRVLDDAIQLVLDDEGRVELSTLAEVMEVRSAMDQFNDTQQAILNYTDKAAVPQLVSDRDKSRIELSDAINAFLVCAQQKLSVQTREAALKYVYDKLSQLIPEGEEDSKLPSNDVAVASAVLSYRQFMEKVIQQRKETQENSDKADQAVLKALQTLSKELTLEGTMETKSADSAVDMSQLFQDYTSALDNEAKELNDVSKMDLLECKELKCVVHSVLVAIEEELKDIGTLRESMQHHAQQQAVVDQWLVKRPDITPLQTCRKISRKLRIEFGHKMVEQKELIDDEDAEELQVVNDELSLIRTKLQMAFAQEAEEMQRIASMVEQFPELLVQYPEFGLQSFTASGGLLLTGRSIDHFERKEHLLFTDQPAFRTTFNNLPCVVKEFHLSSEETLETIIKNSQQLNKLQDRGLVRVLSVFKETNKIFAQLSNYGAVNLLEASASISERDNLSIFTQILQTLALLHGKGVTYGNLGPASVWITRNTESETDPVQVTLSDFALDKSESVRHESSGTPECKSGGGGGSTATDMYCFGKLILWSIQPEATLGHYPDGNPRLAKFSLSDNLRELLEGILHADPKMRLSASVVLTHPYFTPPIPPTPTTAGPNTPPESLAGDDEPPQLDGCEEEAKEEEEEEDKKNTSCSANVHPNGDSGVDVYPMPLLEYPSTD